MLFGERRHHCDVSPGDRNSTHFQDHAFNLILEDFCFYYTSNIRIHQLKKVASCPFSQDRRITQSICCHNIVLLFIIHYLAIPSIWVL